jgi:hypothetical protein
MVDGRTDDGGAAGEEAVGGLALGPTSLELEVVLDAVPAPALTPGASVHAASSETRPIRIAQRDAADRE